MIKLNIKPLSVNKVWKGKRFKTSLYLDYEKEIWWMLPDIKIPEGEMELKMKVGFSSKASDVDNIAKPFIDILQKKYKFDDKNIYRLTMEKEIVNKGKEYIEFEIKKYKLKVK